MYWRWPQSRLCILVSRFIVSYILFHGLLFRTYWPQSRLCMYASSRMVLLVSDVLTPVTSFYVGFDSLFISLLVSDVLTPVTPLYVGFVSSLYVGFVSYGRCHPYSRWRWETLRLSYPNGLYFNAVCVDDVRCTTVMLRLCHFDNNSWLML